MDVLLWVSISGILLAFLWEELFLWGMPVKWEAYPKPMSRAEYRRRRHDVMEHWDEIVEQTKDMTDEQWAQYIHVGRRLTPEELERLHEDWDRLNRGPRR